ncbi:hypothetical protein [Glutamicibacter sp. NPDC087344]|uniref:hypothetical protein n=1 Tax=Glutamicibacter sp. NPDC087344 TaxID=3363994 RepID=UPI0037FB5541
MDQHPPQGQPPVAPAPLPAPQPQFTGLNSALQTLKSPEGLKLLGFQAAAVAVIGVIMAVCYLVALNSMVDEGINVMGSFDFTAQLQSFKSFILLVGVALGGGLHVAGTGLQDESFAEFSISLSLVSLSAIVAIGAANYALVRKFGGALKAQSAKLVALSAALNSLAISVLFVLITLIGKLNVVPDEDFSFSVSPRYSGVFFTLLLVVFLTQFLASTPRKATGSASWAAGVHESLVALVVTLVVFAVVSVIAALVALGGDAPGGVLLLLIPLLGTLGAYSSALGFFGSLASTMTGASTFFGGELDDLIPTSTLKAADLYDGKGAWLFVLTLVVVVLLALFIGVRRARLATSFNANRVWQLPVYSLVLWMLLAWLSNLGAKGSVSAVFVGDLKGSLSFGISWYSVVFVVLGMALISVLAEILPLQVYRFAPGLLAFIGGKQSTARWVSGTAPSALPAQDSPSTPVAPEATEPTTIQPAVVPSPSEAPTEHLDPVRSAPGTPEATFPAVAPTAPAQPVQQVQQVQQVAPNLEPASAEAKKRAKLIGFGALAVVVLVGLGVGTVEFLNSQRKPEAQVEQYLSLLAEGKADEATKLVDPGVDNASRALLNDKTLAKATTHLVVNSVSLENKSENSAVVNASYSINGERQERVFSVDRGEKEYGLLDTWVLNDPLLVQVELSADSSAQLKVGDTEVPLNTVDDSYGSSGYSTTLYAYPGIYEVSAPSSDYLSAEPQTLRVNGSTDFETPSVFLQTQATDALDQLVLDEVQKFAKACVTPPTNMNEACPYSLQDKDLASFSVKTQAESVELSGLSTFQSDEVVFKYKRNNTEYMDYDEEETSKSFSGKITWDGDKPTVEVTDNYWD